MKPTAPALLAAIMLSHAAQASPPYSAESRSAAAVVVAAEAWSIAELSGDAAYVDWLLLPGYVSVDPSGIIHDRAAIVAGARRRAGTPHDAAVAELAAYRAKHPSRNDVKMFGNTAVLSYLAGTIAGGAAVKSSDVFVYVAGHWHAVYSQHSTAEATS